MFTGYLEKILLTSLTLSLVILLLLLAEAYILALFMIVSLISTLIYFYKDMHNAAVRIVDALVHVLGLHDRLGTGLFIAFTMGLFTFLPFAALGLIAVFLRSVHALQLPVDSLFTADFSVSLLCGLPFGLAVGVHPERLDGERGGPLAVVLQMVGERLGFHN